jgi:peptidoglycan hydrolase CwlO-like protein
MAMKREYWIALIVVALVVGLVMGYGIWGSKASQVAELEGKVQQLTQENADLKSKLSSLPAPAAQAPGAPATVAAGPTEQK